MIVPKAEDCHPESCHPEARSHVWRSAEGSQRNFQRFATRGFVLGMTFLTAWLLMACQGQQKLQSAGLKASDTVQLQDTSGQVPALVIFAGAPSSVEGEDQSKTYNVPFEVQINLRNSQQAFNAILWTSQNTSVQTELIFYDTEKKKYPPFQMAPILKTVLTSATQQRHILPFAIEDLAKIDFYVDGALVATFPPISAP